MISDRETPYGAAYVLVRFATEPVALLHVPFQGGDPREELADALLAELAGRIEPFLDAGLSVSRDQVLRGVRYGSRQSEFLTERDTVLQTGPEASVVLCTRNRPSLLRRSLAALTKQSYRRFEIVVVDNTAGDQEVRRVVQETESSVPIEYVAEPRRGLSRARNRGISAASGQILAFIDDDELADEHWLTELVRGYKTQPAAGSVNGLILPTEIRTRQQDWFEQHGGHSKGRGVDRVLIDPADRNGQSPLYPLPPFGAGGNMSFQRSVLEEIGRFDVALGAGTRTLAGEDTAAFTRVLLGGNTILHQPAAVVWHRHYATDSEVHRQFHAYGTGLTGYYAAMLSHDPRLVWPMLQLLPDALRDFFGKGSLRTASRRADYPSSLSRTHLRGMMGGPYRYFRARLDARRVDSR